MTTCTTCGHQTVPDEPCYDCEERVAIVGEWPASSTGGRGSEPASGPRIDAE